MEMDKETWSQNVGKYLLTKNQYHLFTAVRRKVEDKDCEEGDAHARDDQVHLGEDKNINIVKLTQMSCMYREG